MADATLARARAQLAEAKAAYKQNAYGGSALDVDPHTKAQLYETKVWDALSIAKEALVSFRRSGDLEKRVEALKVVVEANLALENSFDALLAANDELAMIKRTKNKKVEVDVLEIVADTQVQRGDASGALSNSQELLTAQKELGNKRGEAKALSLRASAKLLAGKLDALADAEAAVALFGELGDQPGEEAAKRTVNTIHMVRGNADKAPSRPEALRALQDLAQAAEMCDRRAWDDALEALSKTAAYTQRDVDDALMAVLPKDRKVISAFLQEQGMQQAVADAPQFKLNEVNKRITYLSFLGGGLGYGPRFRCLQGYKSGVEGQTETYRALGAIKVYEDADDWEKELQFHPGTLDACLQVQSVFG